MQMNRKPNTGYIVLWNGRAYRLSKKKEALSLFFIADLVESIDLSLYQPIDLIGLNPF